MEPMVQPISITAGGGNPGSDPTAPVPPAPQSEPPVEEPNPAPPPREEPGESPAVERPPMIAQMIV